MQAPLFEPTSTYTPSDLQSVFCGEVQAIYKRNRKHSALLNKTISNSLDINLFLRSIWPLDLTLRERMFAVFTNRKNMITGYSELSAGGISGTVCDAKLLFQKALLANASGFILAHCHPSGNNKPSVADIDLTKRIKKAGEVLTIQLLDHLILTENTYLSFADEGLL
ncbi:MAG: JAB domain-containing protein [Sediminibacterium sp.]|nr:JAB domain-containing protein [Sediminibacterium sp.]